MTTDYPADEQTPQLPDKSMKYAILVDGYVRDLFATGMILHRLGYDVFIANSGEDALKLIEVALPELVITELSLRNMSGLELLFQLKHTPDTKDIPVIIHTAIGDEKWEGHCRATGCVAFLRKPVELDELYNTIQRATEDKPRLHARLRTLLPVRVGGHLSNDAAASIEYISEVSENGIFVRTLTPRPLNAILPVNMIINSLPIKLRAAVVRRVNIRHGLSKEPGMGMQFVEISDNHRELLKTFIRGEIMRDINPS